MYMYLRSDSFRVCALIFDCLIFLTMTIPEEYLPLRKVVQEDDAMTTLFDDSNEDENEDSQLETIANFEFKLKLPPDVGTLFCDRVWSGSRMISEFLASNRSSLIRGKCTVELGAGTALPSLVALACGSKLSVITDYPDELVIQAIRETVGANWQQCQCNQDRVAVIPHDWGSSVDPVLLGVRERIQGVESFDVAILSECIWMHRSHSALAQSMDLLLHPVHGKAIVTYAHHIPGMESADNAFFDVCMRRGFKIAHEASQDLSYMWDDTKRITIHLKVLERET